MHRDIGGGGTDRRCIEGCRKGCRKGAQKVGAERARRKWVHRGGAERGFRERDQKRL